MSSALIASASGRPPSAPSRLSARDGPNGRRRRSSGLLQKNPQWPSCSAAAAPLAVHGVGEPAQPGHERRVHVQLVAERAAVRGHGAVGDGGQRGAAGCDVSVVSDQRRRDLAVRAHPLEGRRLDHAVAQREAGELERL
jgi:hypothetical protein